MIRISIVALIVLICTAPAADRQLDEVSVRILEAIRKGWNDRVKANQRAPGYVKEVTVDLFDRTKPPGKGLMRRSVNVMKVDRRSDSFLSRSELIEANEGYGFIELCSAMNSKYCFELTRRGGRAKPWLVSKTVVTTDPDLDTKDLGFENPGQRPSRRPALIGSIIAFQNEIIGIDRLCEQQHLTIKTVNEEPGGDPRAVVEFIYDNPQVYKVSDPAATPVRASVQTYLAFDAKNSYLPLELRQTISAHGEAKEFHTRWEYTTESGLPTHEKKVVRRRAVLGQRTVQDLEEAADVRHRYGPVPESEFTLSAYGFPEPSGVEWRRGVPAYIWALVVGVVCLAAWVVMARRRTRQVGVS